MVISAKRLVFLKLIKTFISLHSLGHMGFSIFVLFYVKNDLLYLIPMFGAITLLCEAITTISCFKAMEPIRWFSLVFFIYVSAIVTCIWLLELENVKSIRLGEMKKDYNLYNHRYFGKPLGSISQIIGAIKVVWSQLEIQIFLALVMIVRWILPNKNLSPHGLNDLLFRYFGISCDMLDFLAILQDPVLIKSDEIVYTCLSIWTWSTFQFFIYVPKYDIEIKDTNEKRERREFRAYISNSLLMVFFLDLPYFCVRMAAIFGYGSHNYNSYFFAIKNIVMILLQIARIKATFSERSIKQKRNIKQLNGKIGFDQDKDQSLYNRELDEVPMKNFKQRFKNRSNSNINYLKTQNIDNSEDNSFSSTPVRTPKASEQKFNEDSNTSTPLLSQKPITFEEQKSRNASNCSTPVSHQRSLNFSPTTRTNYFSPVPFSEKINKPTIVQKPMGMPITQRLTDF